VYRANPSCHDPERSRSWPQHIWGLISRKRLERETWLQWSTYRKWHLGYQMLTWLMTSGGVAHS